MKRLIISIVAVLLVGMMSSGFAVSYFKQPLSYNQRIAHILQVLQRESLAIDDSAIHPLYTHLRAALQALQNAKNQNASAHLGQASILAANLSQQTDNRNIQTMAIQVDQLRLQVLQLAAQENNF